MANLSEKNKKEILLNLRLMFYLLNNLLILIDFNFYKF